MNRSTDDEAKKPFKPMAVRDDGEVWEWSPS
jgi:hypothetical protein